MKSTFFLIVILSIALHLLLRVIHFGRYGVLSVRRLVFFIFIGVTSEMLINTLTFTWSGFSDFSVEHIRLSLQRWTCAVVVGILLHHSLMYGLVIHILVFCSPIISWQFGTMSCRRVMVLMCIARRLSSHLKCQSAKRQRYWELSVSWQKCK